MTSQRLSIQSIAPFAIVWPQVERDVGIRNFGVGGVRRSRAAQIESPSTTSQRISIQSFALSATIWPQFQCQIMATNPTLHLGGSGGPKRS